MAKNRRVFGDLINCVTVSTVTDEHEPVADACRLDRQFLWCGEA